LEVQIVTLSSEYDGWHERVFQSAPGHPDESSPWYNIVLEYLVPVTGKRVLEVACGRGGFVKLLTLKGGVMFGADFSSTALGIARRKTLEDCGEGIHARFTQADAQQLPYAKESFDIVISCETIEHVLDPLSAVMEMARVCRTGGLLYLTTPNYFNAMGLYYVYTRIRKRDVIPKFDQPLNRIFLFPEVRSLVRRCGWKIIRSDGTVHQFPIWPGHNPVALPWLESNRFLRRVLKPFAYHYFIMCRKEKA
jgi:2-polyprenyl-6-hydroxyphenyl methylase/3-demethylubiquinone-9 3-methyltransferase